MKLKNILIVVNDIELAKKFYHDLFGLEVLLDRFKVGTDAMLFNGYTSVNLDANLIAFNVKDLLYSKNKRVITTQLVNLLTYLNNIIVCNKII